MKRVLTISKFDPNENEVTPFLWTYFAIQPATFTRPLVALPLAQN